MTRENPFLFLCESSLGKEGLEVANSIEFWKWELYEVGIGIGGSNHSPFFLESYAGNGVGEIGKNEKFEIEWRGKEGNHGAFASARENKNLFLLLLLPFMKQIHKGAWFDNCFLLRPSTYVSPRKRFMEGAQEKAFPRMQCEYQKVTVVENPSLLALLEWSAGGGTRNKNHFEHERGGVLYSPLPLILFLLLGIGGREGLAMSTDWRVKKKRGEKKIRKEWWLMLTLQERNSTTQANPIFSIKTPIRYSIVRRMIDVTVIFLTLFFYERRCCSNRRVSEK